MQLDFRTKFLMTLVVITISISGVFIATLPFLAFGISALPFIFLLHAGKYRMAIQGLILVILSLCCKIFLNIETMNVLVSALLAFSYIMLAILPGVMMGYYALTTTKMSDLVCSLHRMRIPDALLIPISVMFRFFYSVREDYGQINNAMKMHGLTLGSAFQ